MDDALLIDINDVERAGLAQMTLKGRNGGNFPGRRNSEFNIKKVFYTGVQAGSVTRVAGDCGVIRRNQWNLEKILPQDMEADSSTINRTAPLIFASTGTM